jgi:hypothetical protein
MKILRYVLPLYFNLITLFHLITITADAKHTNHPNVRIGRGVSGEYRRGVIERSQHI